MSGSYNGTTSISNTSSTYGSLAQGPLTYAIWMKATNAGESSLGNLMRREGTNNVSINFQASGDRLGFVITRSTQNQARTSDDYSFGVWQWVVCTWDGNLGNSATTIHMYLNCVEVSYVLTQNGSGTHTSSDGNFMIGNSSATDRTFNGLLSDAHIYSRVLDVAEMFQLMRYPGSITKNLESYHMIPNGDAVCADYSGYNRTATSANVGTSIDGPPILGRFVIPSPFNYSFTAAAAGLSIPVAMYDYRKRRVA